MPETLPWGFLARRWAVLAKTHTLITPRLRGSGNRSRLVMWSRPRRRSEVRASRRPSERSARRRFPRPGGGLPPRFAPRSGASGAFLCFPFCRHAAKRLRRSRALLVCYKSGELFTFSGVACVARPRARTLGKEKGGFGVAAPFPFSNFITTLQNLPRATITDSCQLSRILANYHGFLPKRCRPRLNITPYLSDVIFCALNITDSC